MIISSIVDDERVQIHRLFPVNFEVSCLETYDVFHAMVVQKYKGGGPASLQLHYFHLIMTTLTMMSHLRLTHATFNIHMLLFQSPPST